MKAWLDAHAFQIVGLVFLIVAGLGIYQWTSGQTFEDRAGEEVVRPYFAAIAEGRYGDAHAFYSEARAKAWTSSDLEQHYAKILAEEGPIAKADIYGVRGQVVDVQLTLKSGFYAITYTLAEDASGRLRIDSGVSTTRNLQKSALPW